MEPTKIQWRKASRSGVESACVETAAIDGTIAVRDSKNLDGPQLTFTPTAWQSFLTSIKTNVQS